MRIAGVIDTPAAAALFQTVGAPPAATQAPPPDNVLFLACPLALLFDGLARTRPDLVRFQIHANMSRASLPGGWQRAPRPRARTQPRNEAPGIGIVGNNSPMRSRRPLGQPLRRIVFCSRTPGSDSRRPGDCLHRRGRRRRRVANSIAADRGARLRSSPARALRDHARRSSGGAAGLLLAVAVEGSLWNVGFGATTHNSVLWSAARASGHARVCSCDCTAAWRDARLLTVVRDAARSAMLAGLCGRNCGWTLPPRRLGARLLVDRQQRLQLVLAWRARTGLRNYYSFLAPICSGAGRGCSRGGSPTYFSVAAAPYSSGSCAASGPLAGTVAATMTRSAGSWPAPRARRAGRDVRGVDGCIQRNLQTAGGGRCSTQQWCRRVVVERRCERRAERRGAARAFPA